MISKIRGMRETVGIDVGHFSIKYVKVLHGATGNKIVVDANLDAKEVEKQALAQEKIKTYTDGHTIVKVIVVPKKIVNIVIK